MEVRKGYKQTEVGVIPEDWNVNFLGEIGKFKNGINKGSEAFGQGTPFVNLMDVFGVNSIASTENLGLITCSNFEQSTYNLRRGDVIFIRSSVKPSGVGLTAVVENDLPATVYSGFLIRFRDGGTMDIGYKRFCFYEERFRNSLIGSSTVSANTNINQESLKRLCIPLPPTLAEQEAIAEALSDADALIEAVEQLLTKKRQVKQGTMSELLTGKRRLSGFSGEWEMKRLGEVLTLRYGKGQKDVIVNGGKFPIIATSGEVGRTNQYLYDKPSVIIGRKGTIDKPQYIDIPFWTIDTAYYSEISKQGNPKFLFYLLTTFDWYSYNEASGVPSLNAKTVENIEISLPMLPEQTAIAEILSDMDAEISALEEKLVKARQVKAGMMSELLTGKIRLI